MAKDKEVAKVYKFESLNNPYLYVGVAKAQFIKGFFETDNLEVAKIVANISDVREVK